MSESQAANTSTDFWKKNAVMIRSKLLVEVVNEYNYTIAFAKRKDVQSSWDIAILSADEPGQQWKHVATVRTNLPEVMQRKMVLAILRTI